MSARYFKGQPRGDKDAISLSVHCPQCRRPMVLRKGPENHFYGCSGFPNQCSHTITIAQARGLLKHIQKRKCADKGKAARRAAEKRIDWTADIRRAETALHRKGNEAKSFPVRSRKRLKEEQGGYRAVTEKAVNHRGTDCLEQ